MGLIVGVHGIGQQYKGGSTLREVWLPAIQDGMTAAGQGEKSRALKLDDVTVGFFGDLFRPRGSLGGGLPPYRANDLKSTAEIELLTNLYAGAVAQEPSLGPPKGSLGPGRVAVQAMVERLLRSKTFAGLIPERAFVGNLKQVIEFLTDDKVKTRVLARVAGAVTPDTRVIIGHSLGSVVAYEYLCHYKPCGVRTLVTLGSPLGIRNVVYERLTPTPTVAGGRWAAAGENGEPAGVNAWVNVADADDVVALQKNLSPLFPRADSSNGVSDRLVDNGGEPHGIQPYLTAPQTGSAIADALD
jgi:hypothetical protein